MASTTCWAAAKPLTPVCYTQIPLQASSVETVGPCNFSSIIQNVEDIFKKVNIVIATTSLDWCGSLEKVLKEHHWDSKIQFNTLPQTAEDLRHVILETLKISCGKVNKTNRLGFSVDQLRAENLIGRINGHLEEPNYKALWNKKSCDDKTTYIVAYPMAEGFKKLYFFNPSGTFFSLSVIYKKGSQKIEIAETKKKRVYTAIYHDEVNKKIRVAALTNWGKLKEAGSDAQSYNDRVCCNLNREFALLTYLGEKFPEYFVKAYAYYRLDLSSPIGVLFEQFCQYDSLINLMQSTEYNGINKMRFIVWIINGIYFLHQDGLLHKDVKSANIGVLEPGEYRFFDVESIAPVNDPTPFCTKIYAPPEYMFFEQWKKQFPDKEDRFKYDVYSVGLTIYQFYQKASVTKFNEDPSQARQTLSNAAKTDSIHALTLRMVEKDIKKRITMDDAKKELESMKLSKI